MNYDGKIKKTENTKGIKIGDFLFFMSMIFVVGFPIPSIFKAISIVAFFLYTFLLQIIQNKALGNMLHYFWAVSFFAYCHISKMWSVFPEAAKEVISNVQWCMLLSVAIVNYIIIYKLTVIDIAKRMALVACVFMIDVMIFGTFFKSRLTLMVGDYLVNANTFGQIPIGIACFLLFWAKKKKWKNFFLISAVIILLTVSLLSGSRKTLLSIIIYIIFIAFYEYPSDSAEKTIGKILGITAIFVIAYICIFNIDVLYDTIGSRMETLFDFLDGNDTSDDSAKTRMMMMENAFEMFKNKPFFGYGLNTFSWLTKFNTYSHNNYVELLANLGFVGFSVYYIPLFVYFYKAYKNWAKGQDGSILPLASMFVFLVNDFANVSYFALVPHVFLAFAIGLSINNTDQTMSKEINRNKKEPKKEQNPI